MRKCDECGSNALEINDNAVVRYGFGGLPHVELRGVEVSRCKKCGAEEITIPRIEQLHQVLANLFINQIRSLAPVEIRFLRKHIGLSTNDFADCMGVTRETVSRWETGSIPIGPQADRLLRLLVASSSPVEDYAVMDLLREIDSSKRGPKNPHKFGLAVTASGWRHERELVSA